MSLEKAATLLMLSFDSTIRANLSVGLPLDLGPCEADSLTQREIVQIDAEDTHYREVTSAWARSLEDAFQSLPSFNPGIS
ncbi:MAG: putative proteasome-type protease [Candidatus Poriferisodalaceae bacterium]|jgi:putative proteasome-type protease